MHHQLKSLRCLDAADFETLKGLLAHEETADKGTYLVMEGREVNSVSILSEGWAVRYKTLSDGRRQILNILLPGDIVGFFALLFKVADYGIETLTPVRLNVFTPELLLDACRYAPRLAIALGWLAGQDERQLDEQIMRIGRRGATERIAHLFMELHHRLLQVGISDEDARSLPLTQTVLADTLGMSHVHTNRSFRALVREGLVTRRDGEIVLLDTGALARLAGFNAAYLEQEPLPASLPVNVA
jgi:CRP-like cAMP-binding protein